MENIASQASKTCPSQTISAKELVERIQNGDSLAETLLIEKYQRGLRMALLRKSNQTIAEDVCQETWRVLIENLRKGKLRDPEKLAAYIVQTGRNQLIMYFRKHENSGADTSRQEELCDTVTPQETLEQERRHKAVRLLLENLKQKRDQDILKRYFILEQEKSQICEALDLSDLHFNRVIHRAKERFRQLVENSDFWN